jgi:hypothetical protein
MMKIVKITEQTNFHIDYEWFNKNGQDVNVLIHKCLTSEQIEAAAERDLNATFDAIDPQTGEVSRVTYAMHLIRHERASDPEYISPRTPVAEAAFRAFLVNNNVPLSAAELAAKIGRTSKEVIDRLGGRVVYNGIKPIMPS